MSVISGIRGVVNNASTVRGWSIQSTSDLQAYSASNTKKGRGRVPGNIDWSGQYQAYGHTPAVFPGEIFTFGGAVDGVKGIEGQAIVREVSIVIDIEGGRIIEHTVQFDAKGSLNKNKTFNPALVDAVVPNPPTSIGCKVQVAPVAGAPTFVEETDVRSVTLRLFKDLPSYASSNTAGVLQRVDANMDFELSYGRYVDDFNLLLGENDIRQVRVFVNATQFYDLKWAMCSAATDLEVDIEGGTPVSGVTNMGMNGYTEVSGTPTEGAILLPDGSTYWPEP